MRALGCIACIGQKIYRVWGLEFGVSGKRCSWDSGFEIWGSTGVRVKGFKIFRIRGMA